MVRWFLGKILRNQVTELFGKFLKNIESFNLKENRKIVHISSVYVRKVIEEALNGGVKIEISKEDIENRWNISSEFRVIYL